MSEIVVLDAVSVATIARAVRDLCDSTRKSAPVPLEIMPETVADAVRACGEPPLSEARREVLRRYATELDEIAEVAVSLDQHEHEIEHQLRWWGERADALQARLTGHPGDDVDTVRELALYRGRMSGATTMRRHYAQQRVALVERHRRADALCAEQLTEP